MQRGAGASGAAPRLRRRMQIFPAAPTPARLPLPLGSSAPQASLHHPNLVRYHDGFIHGEYLCAVMDLLPAGDLRGVIRWGLLSARSALHCAPATMTLPGPQRIASGWGGPGRRRAVRSRLQAELECCCPASLAGHT